MYFTHSAKATRAVSYSDWIKNTMINSFNGRNKLLKFKFGPVVLLLRNIWYTGAYCESQTLLVEQYQECELVSSIRMLTTTSCSWDYMNTRWNSNNPWAFRLFPPPSLQTVGHVVYLFIYLFFLFLFNPALAKWRGVSVFWLGCRESDQIRSNDVM